MCMVYRSIFIGDRECGLCSEEIRGFVTAVNHLTEYHAGDIDGAAGARELLDDHMTEVRVEV